MKKFMLVDHEDLFAGNSRSRRDSRTIPMDDLKIYKKWKKFLKKEEEEKSKKNSPAGWWNKKSVAERTTLIMVFGPPAGLIYAFTLYQFTKMLAMSVGIH